jgi:hypothetical protein
MHPNPENRVRLIDNRILPHVETILSWLGSTPMQLETVAGSDSADERDKSRLRTKVLEYYDSLLGLEEVVDENDLWAVIAGNGYVKVTWDPDLGSEMDMDADFAYRATQEAGLRDGLTEQIMGTRRNGNVTIKSGDLRVDDVSPLDITFGPSGVQFKHAEWLLETRERSAAYIWERYGIKPEDLPVNDQADKHTLWRDSDMSPSGVMTTHRDDGDQLIVRELWVKKNAAVAPQGKFIVSLRGKVIHNGPNPYNHGEIPYVHWKFLVKPGNPFGMSPIDNLLSPQSDRNRNISQQAENRELMANPVTYYEPGVIVNHAQFNNAVGGKREVNRLEGIKTEPGHAMPAVVVVQGEEALKSMQDVVGTHDVSQAKAPSNVKSGIAISLLQEKDEARLNRIQRRKERCWEQVGHLMLKTLQQFLKDDTRVGVIAGEGQATEVIRFSGELLAGEHYRVRVRTTGMPRSRSGQQALMKMLFDAGYFTPNAFSQEDKSRIARMLQIGDTGGIDPTAADRNRAKYENDRMVDDGETIEPKEFERHEVHIEEHNIRQRTEYGLGEDTLKLFGRHVEAHMMLQARLALKQRMIMQQAIDESGMVEQQAGAAEPVGAGRLRDNGSP